MALNIKNPETHRLAQELADSTGGTLTDAVTEALRERLDSLSRTETFEILWKEVEAIQAFVSDLPDRDDRSPEELLGFDAFGLPR
jgi:antitoxin VapB